MFKPSILLVGGGNMGRALLAGWEDKNLFSDVTVVDPHPAEELKKYDVHANSYDIKRENFDIIVLAVKPQIVPQVLMTLKRFMKPDTLFLSIAAGKTIPFMAEALGQDAAIIRTMPNTPALIGQGMTVCVAGKNVSAIQKNFADALMAAVGDVVWIDDEQHMHAVTALSGSGPAYVFALIEAMQKAGVAMGLETELAAKLARKTVEGAAALAAQSPDKTPETLRANVTSPNGTTEAALKVLLTDNGLDTLLQKALKAAAQRSQELS